MSEKNRFKVAYPAFKDSLQPDNDFWPQYSLNPIFSIIFGAMLKHTQVFNVTQLLKHTQVC